MIYEDSGICFWLPIFAAFLFVVGEPAAAAVLLAVAVVLVVCELVADWSGR